MNKYAKEVESLLEEGGTQIEYLELGTLVQSAVLHELVRIEDARADGAGHEEEA